MRVAWSWYLFTAMETKLRQGPMLGQSDPSPWNLLEKKKSLLHWDAKFSVIRLKFSAALSSACPSERKQSQHGRKQIWEMGENSGNIIYRCGFIYWGHHAFAVG